MTSTQTPFFCCFCEGDGGSGGHRGDEVVAAGVAKAREGVVFRKATLKFCASAGS